MKKSSLLSFLTMSLFFFSCGEKAQTNTTNIENSIEVTNRIEVIDFYGTHRCFTCEAIEASAKYTVETYFAEEQKKGIVIFKTVNVDDDENYKMAEAYEATGTALFLNVVKNGKETHIDLTDFGFSKGTEQEEFSKELKTKIETELKTL